jgi:hypothetical protein
MELPHLAGMDLEALFIQADLEKVSFLFGLLGFCCVLLGFLPNFLYLAVFNHLFGFIYLEQCAQLM